MYIKSAVDKCDLGTHFVLQVISHGDYQNPLRLHLYADLKAPAVDTISNQKFIYDSYFDEIDGFHRGGLLITFTNHEICPPKSFSCVLLLQKEYRIQRTSVEEIVANIEAEHGGGRKKMKVKENLYCI